MKAAIREQLLCVQEVKQKDFSAKLLPGVTNILGIKSPLLRKMAKEIAQGDWQTFLQINDADLYFEEIMLQGMVIGTVKTDIETKLDLMKAFIPKIDNWSVCDGFCASFKLKAKEKQIVWQFLLPYLQSEAEFEVRFAVVMLLDHYIDEEHIEAVLALLDKIKHDGYYAKMAVAWTISLCYIRFPVLALKYLQANNLADFTYNAALQKILDSFRVSAEDKQIIRTMKRSKKS